MILGILVFLYFIYICLKTIGLVKRELGLSSAVVIVIGMMLLSSSRNQLSSDPSNEFKQWQFNNDTLFSIHKPQKILLDKNLMFDINLYCIYGYHKKSNQLLPISAKCYTTGVLSGIEWRPEYISIFTDSSGSKLKYEVNGTILWKLLNARLISEHKKYTGTINVDNTAITVK
jgi:hypothetical protein